MGRINGNTFRDIIEWILITIAFISVASMALATVGSIIYCIYQWGGNGLPFASSLWEACKLWIQMVGYGLIGLAISYITLKFVER